MQYTRNPERIRAQSAALIRELVDLSAFTPEQQQVVIHMVRAYGDPDLAPYIRFSENAIKRGLKAIKHRNTILYDIEMVGHALDTKRLPQEPLSFLNRAVVISQAKLNHQTRTMTAVDYWKPYLKDSVVLIGQSGTALFRLLELIQDGAPRPALIIAAARGFVNATASKQLLWDMHRNLDIDCIMVEGSRGGGVLAATAYNSLLWLDAGLTI